MDVLSALIRYKSSTKIYLNIMQSKGGVIDVLRHLACWKGPRFSFHHSATVSCAFCTSYISAAVPRAGCQGQHQTRPVCFLSSILSFTNGKSNPLPLVFINFFNLDIAHYCSLFACLFKKVQEHRGFGFIFEFLLKKHANSKS